jgi:hypothetical protein
MPVPDGAFRELCRLVAYDKLALDGKEADYH